MKTRAGARGEPGIRAYRSGDEHDLVRLLGGVFGNESGLAHWRWKFTHWPTTAANVWLAMADGNAVFHYGGIPLRYSMNDRAASVMISTDAMTAPAYRRRGLLTQGVQYAFADWNAQGIQFTLGLPNERWGSRIAAAGWQALFPLQWMLRPIRPEVFAARRLGIPWLRRAAVLSTLWRRRSRKRLAPDSTIRCQLTRLADGSFDRCWENIGSDWRFSTVRDSDWVRWRFLGSPTRKYDVVLARRGVDVVGYCASYLAKTAEKTSAFVAELIAAEGDRAARETLLADVLARADDAGADSLTALAVPGTALHASLRRGGFLAGPAFGVHVVPFAPDLPIERMRNPEHWNLSGADFDVV